MSLLKIIGRKPAALLNSIGLLILSVVIGFPDAEEPLPRCARSVKISV